MAQLNRGWMVVGVITLLLVLLVAIAIGIAFTNQNLATGALPPYSECNGIKDILTNGLTADGYCAYVWSENVGEPRAIFTLDNGDVIVLERSSSQISIHWDDNGNGVSDKSENAVLVKGVSGLNHAVRFHDGYLYASKDTTVFRWPYVGDRNPINATAQVVVQSIPGSGHSTRPVEFDQSGRIYVNLGSGSNVDANTTRTVIKRFNLTAIPEDGYTWDSGEIFASGMRNEVGLRIDANGYLWGVENGIDNLQVNGQDIHNDNPCEELNAFGYPDTVPAGTFFYGYPYCWSEYIWADGQGQGTQWVHPSFSSSYSNDWCQNDSNVQRPALCLPAHTAPLDILFYNQTSANTSLTSSLVKYGDAFVSLHGSWDRDTPQGYRVVRVSFNATNAADNFVNSPSWPVNFVPFLYYAGDAGSPYIDYPNEQTGNGWIRPVGLAVSSRCGLTKDAECLLVSSDTTDNIIAVMKRQQV